MKRMALLLILVLVPLLAACGPSTPVSPSDTGNEHVDVLVDETEAAKCKLACPDIKVQDITKSGQKMLDWLDSVPGYANCQCYVDAYKKASEEAAK